MIDKEKAEEYAKEKIKDMKVGNFNLLEIAHLSNGADIYNPKVEHLLKDRIKQAYVDGLAEGRKEVELDKTITQIAVDKAVEKIETLKKENADLQQRLDWAQGFLDKDVEYDELNKLRKENAELKKQLEDLQLAYTISVDKSVIREKELETQIEVMKLEKEIAELKAQIEKMKCCKNCKSLECVINGKGDNCLDCENGSNWELAE